MKHGLTQIEMREWNSIILVGSLVCFASAQAPQPELDKGILSKHDLATDDAGLVRFFRERTLGPEQVAALKAKLRELGSPKFDVRAHAAAELVKAGLNAKGLLLEVVQNPAADLEVARRAELCLRRIGQGHEVELAQAAARLLKQRKPPGAVAALLEYLPFAGDPQILPAVQEALNSLATHDLAAWGLLRQAVRDPHAGKRIAAGVALIRAGGLENKDDMQALLKDPSANVRLPVTMALVEARDKNAVPLLIERLADAPAEQLWQVSDLLERIAGDKAPAVYPSAKTPPAQVRDAWQKWWAANAATVDLAKLTDAPPYLGYTLVSMMGAKPNGGARVIELRPNREPHWEIDNLTYPLDARVIGPNKVLIAEYLGRRVTERTFKGEILWEMSINMPIACQRLPGGETFIAARNQLLVVDADKKTTFSHIHQNGSISAAFRLRDGQTVFVASTGQCHWLDPKGNELKSFQVGYIYPMGGNLEVLPNRHLLVALYRDAKVAEFDGDGKIVSQLSVQAPVSATRLPNGNTLVSTMTQQVLELDRDGQVAWTYRTDGRALRARGR